MDRRATRLFWILMRIQKSTGNIVALSELVQRGNADSDELRARNPRRSINSSLPSGGACFWAEARAATVQPAPTC